jgi:hypothetical protein
MWRSAGEFLQESDDARVQRLGLGQIVGLPERREMSEEQRREGALWQRRQDDANYKRQLRKRKARQARS